MNALKIETSKIKKGNPRHRKIVRIGPKEMSVNMLNLVHKGYCRVHVNVPFSYS